jgi:uncharacterized protein with HEPN domain
MSRDFRLYLQDILDASERIKAYVGELDFDGFMNDPRTVDAVVRNLEIIGEAAKNLPAELREIQPQIDWKNVARFRDKIAHYYFKINYEIVWSIIEEELSEIAQAVCSILSTLSPPVD